MKLLFSKTSIKFPIFHDHMPFPQPISVSKHMLGSPTSDPCTSLGEKSTTLTKWVNQHDGWFYPQSWSIIIRRGNGRQNHYVAIKGLCCYLREKNTISHKEGEVRRHGKLSINSSFQLEKGKNLFSTAGGSTLHCHVDK